MHFTFKLKEQLEGNCPSTYNKGGSTQETVTESGLPKEFRPYVERALGTAEGMYQKEMQEGGLREAGAYEKFANAAERLGGEAAAERAALDQFKTEGPGSLEARAEAKRQLNQDWNQMVGDDLLKTAGLEDFRGSVGGALGSARNQMAKQGALVDKSMEMRQLENQMKTQAAGTLAGLDVAQTQRYLSGLQAGQGLGEQEYKAAEAGVTAAQGVADAPHRGMERFFGYLGSGALGQSSTSKQTGGGGK